MAACSSPLRFDWSSGDWLRRDRSLGGGDWLGPLGPTRRRLCCNSAWRSLHRNCCRRRRRWRRRRRHRKLVRRFEIRRRSGFVCRRWRRCREGTRLGRQDLSALEQVLSRGGRGAGRQRHYHCDDAAYDQRCRQATYGHEASSPTAGTVSSVRTFRRAPLDDVDQAALRVFPGECQWPRRVLYPNRGDPRRLGPARRRSLWWTLRSAALRPRREPRRGPAPRRVPPER